MHVLADCQWNGLEPLPNAVRPWAAWPIRAFSRISEAIVERQQNGAKWRAIPAELVPSLFDPFRRVKHKRDGSKGLGLGLYITHEIIHAHRGNISVRSSESEGTRFTIVLPRK